MARPKPASSMSPIPRTMSATRATPPQLQLQRRPGFRFRVAASWFIGSRRVQMGDAGALLPRLTSWWTTMCRSSTSAISSLSTRFDGLQPRLPARRPSNSTVLKKMESVADSSGSIQLATSAVLAEISRWRSYARPRRGPFRLSPAALRHVLNGIVLISSILNFETRNSTRATICPIPLSATYTAIAWYHKSFPRICRATCKRQSKNRASWPRRIR